MTGLIWTPENTTRVVQRAKERVEKEVLHERVVTVDKLTDPLMRAVSPFVEFFTGGAQKAERFLKDYTTTLTILNRPTIYTPFTLGVHQDNYPLEWQVVVTWHELIHVWQAIVRMNRWEFNYVYALYVERRVADLEAEAIAHSSVSYQWRLGRRADPNAETRMLHEYGANSEEVSTAAEVVRVKAEQLVPGVSNLGNPVEVIFHEVLEEEFGPATPPVV